MLVFSTYCASRYVTVVDMQLLYASTRERTWPVDVTSAAIAAAVRIPSLEVPAPSILFSRLVGLLPRDHLLLVMVCEQLGRWAAAREMEDTQVKLKHKARCRAKRAALPKAARTKKAVAALHAETKVAAAALPTAVGHVAQLCFLPAVAHFPNTRAKVNQQLCHGGRREELITRFGVGVLCLLTRWCNVE